MTTIGAPQSAAAALPGARFRTETADQVRQETAAAHQQAKSQNKVQRHEENMAQQTLKSKETAVANLKATQESVAKDYAAQEKYVAAVQALADQAMKSRVAANKSDAKEEVALRDERSVTDRQASDRKRLELETTYAATKAAEAGKLVNQSA